MHRRSGTLRHIIENAVWLLAGKGVGAVLSLIYLGMATRTLGPQGFGQFVLILGTAQAVASLVSFQTWQIVVRFGMKHLDTPGEGQLGRLIGFCAALDLGAALFGCLLATVGTLLLGPHLGWDDQTIRGAIAFSIVVLLSIRSTAVGILRLHDRFGLGAAADGVMPVARMAGALVAVSTDSGVTGFLVAWAVAEVTTAIACWSLAIYSAGATMAIPHMKGATRAPAENPGLWHFAAITNAGSTLGGVSKQFALILVGLFAGPAAAGNFRLAHQLGQALARVSEMLSRSIFSELSRVHAGQTRSDLARLFRKASRMAFILGFVILLVLFGIGRPTLELIAGPGYDGAYPLLLLLGTATALEVAGVSFEPALMATGRAGTALRVRLLATLALGAGLALLLPLKGATGAAIAMLAASGVGVVLFGVAAWRAVHPRQIAQG